jgi:hypothetical protein
MTSDGKKPGVAFWATVVLAVALAYPLSIGPAAPSEVRFDGAPSTCQPGFDGDGELTALCWWDQMLVSL